MFVLCNYVGWLNQVLVMPTNPTRTMYPQISFSSVFKKDSFSMRKISGWDVFTETS